MGTPVEPKPTKYFIAFLVADLSLAGGEAELSFKLGGIDARATTMAWQESKFYRGEMGAHLWRGFWSLQSLRSAVDLVAVSSTSKRSKIKFRDPLSGGRRLNLDPAYLDALKVVLASTQNANQRIYLQSGIDAEATFFYQHGALHGLPYYRDYLTSQATEFFCSEIARSMSINCAARTLPLRRLRVAILIASRRDRVLRSRGGRIALMSEPDNDEELAAITTTLKRHLERRQRAGLRYLPKISPAQREPVTFGEIANPAGVADLEINPESHVSLPAETLEDLRATIGDCQRCKLCAGRTHLVFGVGNSRAKLMFVGEGPGRDEDLKGEPFVGRAGQLLTDIITKGMGLKREDVYICNVVKCRPPENRNPEPDEVAACEPFLKRQIDIVRPEIIVALGKFAVQTLLNSKMPISKLRGVWASYHGIKLMPTFHPAYLLRNPADKKLVWEDIKQVIKVMRGENP